MQAHLKLFKLIGVMLTSNMDDLKPYGESIITVYRTLMSLHCAYCVILDSFFLVFHTSWAAIYDMPKSAFYEKMRVICLLYTSPSPRD